MEQTRNSCDHMHTSERCVGTVVYTLNCGTWAVNLDTHHRPHETHNTHTYYPPIVHAFICAKWCSDDPILTVQCCACFTPLTYFAMTGLLHSQCTCQHCCYPFPPTPLYCSHPVILARFTDAGSCVCMSLHIALVTVYIPSHPVYCYRYSVYVYTVYILCTYCVYIHMYTATHIVCVCTGILALLTVVGGYSCTITQIYFYICCACLYYSYGSFKHKCEFCEIHACS